MKVSRFLSIRNEVWSLVGLAMLLSLLFFVSDEDARAWKQLLLFAMLFGIPFVISIRLLIHLYTETTKGRVFHFRTLLYLLCLILFLFAGAYKKTGLVDGDRHGVNDAGTCIYFSAITFTTVGYGDVRPSGTAARAIVCMESFTGLLVWALMIGIITNTLSNKARAEQRREIRAGQDRIREEQEKLLSAVEELKKKG